MTVFGLCALFPERLSQQHGVETRLPRLFDAVRALVVHYERKQGTATGTPPHHGRFRCSSLFWGYRPWNSPIEY